MSFKKAGFTLVETLVTLVIFTIILLASGKVLSNMLKLQTESNIQLTVIDILQSRLQESAIVPTGANVCSSAALTADITIKIKNVDTIYYVACEREKMVKDGVEVEWPVLGASTDQNQVNDCAKGIASDGCFIVGR